MKNDQMNPNWETFQKQQDWAPKNFQCRKCAKGREIPRLKKSKEAPELNATCWAYLALCSEEHRCDDGEDLNMNHILDSDVNDSVLRMINI